VGGHPPVTVWNARLSRRLPVPTTACPDHCLSRRLIPLLNTPAAKALIWNVRSTPLHGRLLSIAAGRRIQSR